MALNILTKAYVVSLCYFSLHLFNTLRSDLDQCHGNNEDCIANNVDASLDTKSVSVLMRHVRGQIELDVKV